MTMYLDSNRNGMLYLTLNADERMIVNIGGAELWCTGGSVRDPGAVPHVQIKLLDASAHLEVQHQTPDGGKEYCDVRVVSEEPPTSRFDAEREPGGRAVLKAGHTPLEELHLPARTYGSLRFHIASIEELLEASEYTLHGFRYLGPKAIQSIVDCLKQRGLFSRSALAKTWPDTLPEEAPSQ
jgi:hypothetical protein